MTVQPRRREEAEAGAEASGPDPRSDTPPPACGRVSAARRSGAVSWAAGAEFCRKSTEHKMLQQNLPPVLFPFIHELHSCRFEQDVWRIC